MMKKCILLILILLTFTWCWNNNNWESYNNYKIEENSYNSTNSSNDDSYIQAPTQKKWNRITIKYRDTMVDVSDFLTTNTSNSSFINNAYYDPDEEYLILNLNWTYYHWCDVPKDVRNWFKTADSKWSYYNKFIKWEFDCRYSVVPTYN